MLSIKRKVLCLDWDRRVLRLVVARIGGGAMKLEDAHALRIPSNVNPDDPAALGGFIAQCLQRCRMRFHRAIVDVPRDKAVINRLKLPPTPPAELAAAVRFQAQRELPFPIDDASIDFAVMEREGPRNATEVLLAAVRLDALQRIRDTCKAAGLMPARIGLRPFANLISVQKLPGMLDRRVLLLDVGPSLTEIDVFRGDKLAFSRSGSVGVPFVEGRIVSDDSRIISSKAELSELERASAAETDAVEELLVEVTRSLQAYRATEPNATIDQIVIAGGTGIESALMHAVDERFGIPTMLFDPTMPLGVAEHEAGKLRGFSAALGLAWGAAKEQLFEIDFLNPKKPIPRRETLKRRLRFAGIAASGLIVIAGGYVVTDFIKLRSEVERLKRENEPLAEQARALVQLEIRAAEAADWARQENMLVWLDHVKAIADHAIQPGKQMVVTDLRCDGRQGRITLKVYADDSATIEQFKKALEEYEVIEGPVDKGKPIRPYRVTAGKWGGETRADAKFKGSIVLTIDVVPAVNFVGQAKAREAQRKEMEAGV